MGSCWLGGSGKTCHDNGVERWRRNDFMNASYAPMLGSADLVRSSYSPPSKMTPHSWGVIFDDGSGGDSNRFESGPTAPAKRSFAPGTILREVRARRQVMPTR